MLIRIDEWVPTELKRGTLGVVGMRTASLMPGYLSVNEPRIAFSACRYLRTVTCMSSALRNTM
jgi:hypothetical protein